MPKKKSYGGEQEYIPAGNGLASGTYADDSGNNAWHSQGKNTDKAPLSRMSKPKQPKPQQPKPQPISQPNGLGGIVKPTKVQKGYLRVDDKDGEYMYGMSEFRRAKRIVDTYQTPIDKELEDLLEKGGTACFGDTMSKEKVRVIIDSIKQVKGDFPFTKINYIGDRDKLEELINAKKKVYYYDEETLKEKIEEWKNNNKFLLFQLSGKTQEEIDNFIKDEVKKEYMKEYDSFRGDCVAWWNWGLRVLGYTEKGEKESIVDIENQYNSGWHPSNKENNTIMHELGHAVHGGILSKSDEIWDKMLGKNMDTTKYWDAKKDFDNEIDRLETLNTNGTVVDGKYRECRISRYAKTNQEEFIAESFSAYYGGMNNELATKVVMAFNKYQKKLKEIEDEINAI